MSHPSHILIISPGFPADENDHYCIPPLQEFIRALMARLPELHIQVIALEYPYHNRSYSWHGIEVQPLGGSNRSGWRSALRALRMGKEMGRQGRPDLVHSFWWGPASWAARRLARRWRIQHVATLMGQDTQKGNPWLRVINRRGSSIVTISSRQTESWTGTPAAEIPWGLSKLPQPSPVRDIDILGAGSFIPLKQYDHFLRFIAEKRGELGLKCVILAGTGPEESKLRELRLNLGLEDIVEMPGQVDRPELLEWMGRTHLFLHPSRYESMGYAMLEARAMGAKVASLKVGIAREGPGWVTASEPVALWENGLRELWVAPQPQPLNRYPMDETIEQYLALYDC